MPSTRDRSQQPASAPLPLVSVIVPCFDAERTLDAAIDSVLRNARPELPLEIIAVDDASRDATLQRLRARGAQLRVLALPSNRGVSHARNAGIELARGEFIAFCDADDVWFDDKLTRQLPLFADPEVGLVCSSGLHFEHTPGDRGSRPWAVRLLRGRVHEALLERNFIGTSTAVVRRAALRGQRFDPDLRHAEDFDLWLRIARDWKVDHVDAALIHYRLSSAQASHDWAAMQESRLRVIRRELATLPRPRQRRRVLARALYGYAMEHWDRRDFPAARAKLLRVVRLQPLHGEAWLRLLSTLLPAAALRRLLRARGGRRRMPQA